MPNGTIHGIQIAEVDGERVLLNVGRDYLATP